jgi:CBS domain-containing protein
MWPGPGGYHVLFKERSMPTETTVQQLLDSKDSAIHSVSPDITVFEGLKVLSEAKIGAVLVLEGGKLVGMFSERDYARKIILQGRSSKDTKIRDIMTTEVNSVSPDTKVKDCMHLMTKNRFRHLPVIKDDQIVGVISIGDIVRAILIALL